MIMRGHLIRCQRDLFGSVHQARAPTPRRAAAQIWQAKSLHPIAAKFNAKQRKQRLIVAQAQQLPIAQRSTFWREIERNRHDRSEKIIHQDPALFARQNCGRL
jgi:hypothetical protein